MSSGNSPRKQRFYVETMPSRLLSNKRFALQLNWEGTHAPRDNRVHSDSTRAASRRREPPVFTPPPSSRRQWRNTAAGARTGFWQQPGTYYGRFGTPTIESLQEAIAALEGGHRSVVYPSGLAACAGALLAFLSRENTCS